MIIVHTENHSTVCYFQSLSVFHLSVRGKYSPWSKMKYGQFIVKSDSEIFSHLFDFTGS